MLVERKWEENGERYYRANPIIPDELNKKSARIGLRSSHQGFWIGGAPVVCQIYKSFFFFFLPIFEDQFKTFF